MADLPGGASGLLVRDCMGKEAGQAVYRTAPGVVSLVAELRGHERQAAEELPPQATADGWRDLWESESRSGMCILCAPRGNSLTVVVGQAANPVRLVEKAARASRCRM